MLETLNETLKWVLKKKSDKRNAAASVDVV